MHRSHTPIVLQENTQKSIENMNFELKRSIIPQFQSPLKFTFSTNNTSQKIGIFLVHLFVSCSKFQKKISCTKKLAKQKFSILTSDVWITLDSCMNEYLSSKKKQDVMFICINVQTKGAVESFRWFRFICYWKDFEITCCWSNSHLFYML